jgi:hypothetical protein
LELNSLDLIQKEGDDDQEGLEQAKSLIQHKKHNSQMV